MLVAKTAARGALDLRNIFALSAWGFVIAIASFLFLYAGWWLDEKFNTAPNFMLGLFLLGIFLCVGRLYQEAWLRKG
jgi:F0F1-type ATP synthase assembly protein I